MRKIILYFLLLNIFLSAGQNQKKIDSLITLIKKDKPDTIKVYHLSELGRQLMTINPDTGIILDNQAIALARKLNWKEGIAVSFDQLGSYYFLKGNFSLALENYLASLKIDEELKNKNGIARHIGNIGNVYKDQADYPKALEYYFKALKMDEEAGNKKSIAIRLSNIGAVYWNQGNDLKALDYFFKAMKIDEETGNKKSMALRYGNIGIVYTEMGDYPKALDYCFKALKMNEKLGEKKGIAVNLGNIGTIYTKTKKYSDAEKYYKDALKIHREIGAQDYERKFEELLSNLYEKTGREKLALQHYKNAMLLKDSLFSQENKKQLVRKEMNYEFDKKEAAIKAEQDKKDALAADEIKIKELQLNRSRYFTYGLSGLVLLILALGFLFFRQNKLQSQQRSLQLEQKLLRSQMNPHFIFNSLAAIESFIYENQPKEAGRYLSDFGRLMRLILENSAEEYVPLQKEIKTLEYYLALQKLRLEEKFIYTIHVDENINTEEVQIPPMLTQPFIENAIEHGLIGNKQEGLLEISFHVREDQLVVEVKDNGVGISKSLQLREPKSKHKSMAIQITKERLKILNRFKKQKLGFLISDISDITKNSTGTKVEFSIPL